MYKKLLAVFFTATLFTGSCSSTPPATVTPTPTSQPPTEAVSTPLGFAIPTPTPLPTLTAVPIVTKEIVVESISTGVFATPVGSRAPVYPGAQKVFYDYFSPTPGEAGNSVYYQSTAPLDDIQAFYMQELVNAGWEWVYTEAGTSLVTTAPTPTLIMEFRKGEEKLGLAAAEFGTEGFLVFAAVGFSGYQQITGYIGGIAGGLDLMGPTKDDAQADMMQFSSTLLEFRHPSNWLANDALMQIFDADGDVYLLPDTGNCGLHMEICFVNFANLTGSHFDIPVSIRAHPEMSGLTLEEANTSRWEELNSNIHAKRYAIPEDLSLPGTLETIEIRNITLGDGTPAIQRIYQWKHENETNPITSTYTLFLSGDMLLEFHTDYSNAEWEKEQSNLDHVIATMKIVP